MTNTHGRGDLTRRKFFERAGLGAVTVGVVACNGDDNGSSSSSAATEPPGTDATSGGTTPPDPTTTTSPEAPPPPPDSGSAPTFSKLGTTENWNQPAVFTPAGDKQLALRVVPDQNNLLFSYWGATPGPTIRMGGTDTVRVQVQNALGEDQGKTTVGYSAGGLGAEPPYAGPEGLTIKQMFKDGTSQNTADEVYGGTPQSPVFNKIPTEPKEDWCLGEHVNGIHTAHVTNMHTHGLHVRPAMNANGTHSDNIYLRIVPLADWEKMQANPECVTAYQEALSIKSGEIVPECADFEFVLGDTPVVPVHPPGTHWYHPHSHGSTHNQVSAGMAGFLIVEGDVDEKVNEYLTEDPAADPGIRTGPWDYRERTVFIQRVFNNVSTDPDRDRSELAPQQPGSFRALTNGQPDPNVIAMRPGAIERWRVLNGSVDGSGYIRVMVLMGRFELDSSGALYRVDDDGTNAMPASETEWAGTMTIGDDDPVELISLKQTLWQLAWDGVTLVTDTSSGPEYTIRDLGLVHDGHDPQFDSYEESYDGDNPVLCYYRPNELALTPANRSDVFFQAPPLTADQTQQTYTIIGLPTAYHDSKHATTSTPTIVGHVVVSGGSVDGDSGLDFGTIPLPDLPPYLAPVPDEELAVTEAERAVLPPGEFGTYRTRTVRYAGWGTASFPRIDVPADQATTNPDQNKLSYYVPPPADDPDYLIPVITDGKTTYEKVTNVTAFGIDELPTMVVPPNTRTMSVDGHKFEPTSGATPVMWVNTAEEWAVFSESIACYSIDPNTVTAAINAALQNGDQAGAEQIAADNALDQVWYTYDDEDGTTSAPMAYGRTTSYPVRWGDLATANENRGGSGQPATIGLLTKKNGPPVPVTASADHPFHIHQNPFWLTSLDVVNNAGELVNVLDLPGRWGDVTFLPRDGGRAVFRSRFADYTGEYVNHCHILKHEDNGMMQRLQVLGAPGTPEFDPDARVASFVTSDTVAGAGVDANSVYPPPTPAEMWLRSATFVDDNNSGQVYPLPSGWVPNVPDPAARPSG